MVPVKIRLPAAFASGMVASMSAVEIAVSKVRKMSAQEARELLAWLAARPSPGVTVKPNSRGARRKTTARQRMKKLKAWHDSVRGMTDWEPPRMPDDLVKVAPL
jgi:hypothetical protein